MVFKNYLKYFVLSIFVFGNVNSATINLFNHSKHPAYFEIDVDNWFDKEVVVMPLESYRRSGIGDINKVSALSLMPPVPNRGVDSAEQLQAAEKLETAEQLPTVSQLPSAEELKKDIKSRLEKSQPEKPWLEKFKLEELQLDDQNLRSLVISIPLDENKSEYNVSFDIDAEDNPVLKRGAYGIEKTIKFLVVSDVHTIAKTEHELSTMNLDLYGGDAKREKVLNKHRNKIAMRDRMISYINDPTKNIRSVIMPGDNAGGYGKKSEKEAFEFVWYNPLRSALISAGGRPFLGIGNHDTYWSSIFEPGPPKMMRFVKKTYGDYNYSYNIGSMHFINLSLCPSFGEVKGIDSSLTFLMKDLQDNVNKTKPIVIFFHYPIHGHMSDWWSRLEKDIFYNVIQDYNVVLIACGHSHKSAKYEFRDKKIPVIIAAGSEFAQVKWQPTNPTNVYIKFIDADGNRVAGSERLRVEEEGNGPTRDIESESINADEDSDLPNQDLSRS